jgi:hypothetical protein
MVAGAELEKSWNAADRERAETWLGYNPAHRAMAKALHRGMTL